MDAFLERPHARIAYSVEGGGDQPPVVITHSFLASRDLEDEVGIFDWSSATDRSLIRFDARGHGASTGEAVEEHYRWRSLAEDLLALVDAAAPGTPAVDVIAESTGCGTVLWAVSLAPERFRRVVLTIPPTIRDIRAEQAAVYRGAAALIEARGGEAWSRLIDTFPPVPLLDAGGWSRARRVPVSLALLPAVLKGAAGSDLPADEVLAALQQEVLILAWTTDVNHPVASAEHLARVLPNSSLEIATEPDQVRSWGERVAGFLGAAEGAFQRGAIE